MAEITDEHLFCAIGHAVVSAQLFEKVFIVAARLAIKHADIQVLQEVETIEVAKAFKQPIKALLKEISGKLPAVELEERIDRLIDERNVVVHHIVDQGPWPGPVTTEERQHLFSLCVRVSEESSVLTEILNAMTEQWIARFPEIKVT